MNCEFKITVTHHESKHALSKISNLAQILSLCEMKAKDRREPSPLTLPNVSAEKRMKEQRH